MVKLTLELKAYLDTQADILSNQLNYYPKPMIIYTDQELKQIDSDVRSIKSLKKHNLGESWARGLILPDKAIIWLNLDNTDFLWQILDTLAHEFAHLKFPAKDHGDEFQNLVNSIVMGKRF